jgi:CYTH domain-containing protein
MFKKAFLSIEEKHMGIEIERKFTVKELPKDLDRYPYHVIEQGYLNVHPAVRVRREDDIYYMTYKGSSMENEDPSQDGNSRPIGKVEYNMPLDKESYDHLVLKADGNMIRKKRYLIPLNSDGFDEDFFAGDPGIKQAVEEGKIKIELDIFDAPFEGTILAEVEFPSEEAARAYKPAEWFFEDVTGDVKYSNSHMSSVKL